MVAAVVFVVQRGYAVPVWLSHPALMPCRAYPDLRFHANAQMCSEIEKTLCRYRTE